MDPLWGAYSNCNSRCTKWEIFNYHQTTSYGPCNCHSFIIYGLIIGCKLSAMTHTRTHIGFTFHKSAADGPSTKGVRCPLLQPATESRDIHFSVFIGAMCGSTYWEILLAPGEQSAAAVNLLDGIVHQKVRTVVLSHPPRWTGFPVAAATAAAERDEQKGQQGDWQRTGESERKRERRDSDLLLSQ